MRDPRKHDAAVEDEISIVGSEQLLQRGSAHGFIPLFAVKRARVIAFLPFVAE